MSYHYGLNVEQSTENIRISGSTFDHKDKIKAIAGAKWNPAEKCWTVPIGSDLSALIQPVVQYRPAKDPGPNMWAFDRLRDVRRRECCSKCKREFDDFNPQGPMWFVCPVHGKWKSDYTGD